MGQMHRSTGSVVFAPDGHSDVVAGSQAMERPRSSPVVSATGAGPGRHSTVTKVSTMAKRTRGPDPSDRLTRISGVKITPPTHADPVPSITTSA